MFEGYLAMGGNEILNSARIYGYTNSAGCGFSWLQCGPCDGLREALGDAEYTVATLTDAPWYDPRDPATGRFYGAYGLSWENISDSTRTAQVTQGMLDGGTVGRVRKAVRETRVRAMLIADGEDALEAGLTWLKMALDPTDCGLHGNACGAVDACFFTACPPERATLPTYTAWTDSSRNLWPNTRAVSTGTAFGSVMNGAGSYVTDFPGTVSTARRWTASAVAASRIVSLPIGTVLPPATQVRVRLRGRTSHQLTGVYLATRADVVGGAGEGRVDLGTIPAGSWERDVVLPGYTGVAGASSGVVLMGVPAQIGATVDVTAIGVELTPGAPAWFDGSTADGDRENYLWLGSPYASLSVYQTRALTQEPEPDDAYDARVDAYSRRLHGVTCISGPLIEQKMHRGATWGYLVEFTLAAASPWVLSETRAVSLAPGLPVVVQDIPYNLVRYPSAELSSGTVTVQTNYAPNPSVETDATGWAVAADGVVPAGQVAGGRITGELAAVGVASYRSVFTATGASAAAGWFGADHIVPIVPTTGQRVSLNMWASSSIASGAPVLGSIEIHALWQNGSNVLLRDDLVGTMAVGGGAVSLKSVLPPVGTARVVMRAFVRVTSWSAGNVVRLYADAVAVTVP
jgi:hypothetical protein